mmetsp:Transcript_12638/g.38689  ORF Transcript_12638/g.38689 Transcript_12638/m.38689 type:complete len:204 (+) Transcript_12638:627-1238(+)
MGKHRLNCGLAPVEVAHPTKRLDEVQKRLGVRLRSRRLTQPRVRLLEAVRVAVEREAVDERVVHLHSDRLPGVFDPLHEPLRLLRPAQLRVRVDEDRSSVWEHLPLCEGDRLDELCLPLLNVDFRRLHNCPRGQKAEPRQPGGGLRRRTGTLEPALEVGPVEVVVVDPSHPKVVLLVGAQHVLCGSHIALVAALGQNEAKGLF